MHPTAKKNFPGMIPDSRFKVKETKEWKVRRGHIRERIGGEKGKSR
jgi:hypothetical protein